MPNERRYSNELNLESVGINLPYNMQAEQSVLGAVLLKPDTLTDLVEIIKPEMFYTRQNAQAFLRPWSASFLLVKVFTFSVSDNRLFFKRKSTFTTEINFPHEGFPAARLFP